MLVLRGSAALRHVYFGDARRAVDLDFATHMSHAASKVEELLDWACTRDTQTSFQFRLVSARLHPTPRVGCAAWIGRFDFVSICTQFSGRLQVAVGPEELADVAICPLLRRHEDDEAGEIAVYRLEEIAAEKLQALIPGRRHIRPHVVRRKYARHLYDLWFLFTHAEIDSNRFRDLFDAKCRRRRVSSHGYWTLGDDYHLEAYHAGWEGLKALVPTHVPPVAEALRQIVDHLQMFDLDQRMLKEQENELP
jgi:predicted nucleotidyltransferase component of viral defense system